MKLRVALVLLGLLIVLPSPVWGSVGSAGALAGAKTGAALIPSNTSFLAVAGRSLGLDALLKEGTIALGGSRRILALDLTGRGFGSVAGAAIRGFELTPSFFSNISLLLFIFSLLMYSINAVPLRSQKVRKEPVSSAHEQTSNQP